MTETRATAHLDADASALVLRGDWSSDPLPELGPLRADVPAGTQLRIDLDGIESIDGRLTAKLLDFEHQLRSTGSGLQVPATGNTPEQLLHLALSVERHTPPAASGTFLLSSASIRSALAELGDSFIDSLAFLGAALMAMLRALSGRSAMRGREFIGACFQAGPNALGIITLTSILVGMILAYLGAAQLQQFGAAIYVADLVAIGMLREMGALMTAVVMAGRTGAAYAAQLSTMQGNEEIDAISTLGIDPMEFLVVPRILALILMMPLLVVFANLLGVLGGAIVAGGMGVTPLQYISQLQSAVSVPHFMVGMTKALVFAVLIALAGCRAGMSAGRNSAAVGQATTEAVVTAVVYLIVADAAINILCQQLGY